MTATASAPASAAWAASRTVSAVDCAPQWTAMSRRSPAASRKSSAARRRCSGGSRKPSPVVPSASSPSRPPPARKSTYRSNAASSRLSPPSARGVIAAASAVFGFSEAKLGIVPAVISPFVLPRIGPAARRYFLTGERFDAPTALRIGLVHELASDLDGAVEAVLRELLSSGPEAARAAKRVVRERPRGEEAAHVAARLRTSPEGQEGLRAFLEKRRAAWRAETDASG